MLVVYSATVKPLTSIEVTEKTSANQRNTGNTHVVEANPWLTCV